MEKEINEEFLEERGIGVRLDTDNVDIGVKMIGAACDALKRAIISHYRNDGLVKKGHYVSVFFISDDKPLAIRRHVKLQYPKEERR